jgi:hypothetical protein
MLSEASFFGPYHVPNVILNCDFDLLARPIEYIFGFPFRAPKVDMQNHLCEGNRKRPAGPTVERGHLDSCVGEEA